MQTVALSYSCQSVQESAMALRNHLAKPHGPPLPSSLNLEQGCRVCSCTSARPSQGETGRAGVKDSAKGWQVDSALRLKNGRKGKKQQQEEKVQGPFCSHVTHKIQCNAVLLKRYQSRASNNSFPLHRTRHAVFSEGKILECHR